LLIENAVFLAPKPEASETIRAVPAILTVEGRFALVALGTDTKGITKITAVRFVLEFPAVRLEGIHAALHGTRVVAIGTVF